MSRLGQHFPTLEAPPDGLARLRERLDRQPPRLSQFRRAAAAAAVLVVLASTPWLLNLVHTRQNQSLQLEELRRTLAEHRAPPLVIDGERPRPLGLESERVEAYFLDAER
ncbi:MAG: hypothetical protein GVY11_02190 [Gammaproteobacteria bacterium]|jgi:hypothetical protein|nr:hypothetical protein [Gammaproteobacteria bacterium]